MNDSKEKKIYKSGRYWTKKQLERYRKYQIKYMRKTYKTFVIRFNYKKEKDLIDFIESQSNITNCVRAALISEMNNSK